MFLCIQRVFAQQQRFIFNSTSLAGTSFSTTRPTSAIPRIAIIGSGPSGLYVCARLLQRLPKCQIDVFDKAQAPYGLIYYGVAPDHLDMKKSMHSFEQMFSENPQRLALFCNVDVNWDTTYDELCAAYEVVVLAYGANRARKLGLANENAPNCFSGLEFVSWYNGVPHFTRTPQLDQEDTVVVGNGNVAIDCTRILLTSPHRLAQTDIPEQALQTLRKSKVRNVRILGRRGPKEISFTIKELRELLGLQGVNASCEIEGAQSAQLKHEIAQMARPRRRLMELMLGYSSSENAQDAKNNPRQKNLQLLFHRQPVSIHVDPSQGGRVTALCIRNTLTGVEEQIPCGLLIYAIGFENVLLRGLPRTEEQKDQLKMVDWCRVPDEQAAVYATGWCSHAARGLIADSQQQAYSVADQIVEDWDQGQISLKSNGDGSTREKIIHKLQSRNVNYVSWNDWRHIDECERRMGAILGKTREKLTDYTTMLRIMRMRSKA